MTSTIVHRGPDDSGEWVDASAGIALGFRRLSIIDLSPNGHQPMQSASRRFWMIFNGEVYNFPELRRTFELDGTRFRGHSDTEVILAAVDKWGLEATLPRLRGMFALAVWDTSKRLLHLARDRFGKKPLYVHHVPGYVSFGSELRTITSDPRFDRDIDPSSVRSFLRHLYVPGPQTIYGSVRKLEPGCVLTFRDVQHELPPARAYWSLHETALGGVENRLVGDDREVVNEGERLLTEAVRSRMIADVPLGAFLSGGVDSSTVVALMTKCSSTPVRTFGVAFDESTYDEGAHAAAVAKHLGTEHTEIRLTSHDALALVPGIADWFDEPFADPSQLPTYLVCREARREVTVALTGDGGDELFCGYNRYTHGARVIAGLSRLPRAARRMAAAALLALPSSAWNRLLTAAGSLGGMRFKQASPGERLYKLALVAAQPDAAEMYRSLLSAWQDPTLLLADALTLNADSAAPLPATGRLSLVDQMMLVDQTDYLVEDLLAKVDRVSMAVSLEVRVPLLDHSVAEFAWRLRPEHRIRDGRGKWLLRAILARHVPLQLTDRPKMGFSVPIQRWLRGELRDWASELLSPSSIARTAMLEPAAVARAWAKFLSGSDELANGMWALLMFQAWHSRWVDSPSRSAT